MNNIPDDVDATYEDDVQYSSSEDDSDFKDSDYDLADEDDDLFMDNVDDQVVDQGVAMGRKVPKGKRAQVMVGRGDEDFSTDDEGLMVPNSDAENNVTFNFKSFKHEDLVNPVFKVGMIFESVELLRKGIIEYSLKHRVDIKMPRNEKKRLRAICEKGCP